MIVYSAAAVGGVLTVGYNGVAVALFVSRLPASAMPFAFILPAISIVLTFALYNRLASRFSLPQLAAGSSVMLLLTGLLFRLLLATGYGRTFPVLAGVFLYCETSASLVVVQFWTFAGQIFNPREARRLFGLIAAGGTVSSVVAGLSLAVLVRFIGVENLLFVVVGALGVSGACAGALARYIPRPARAMRAHTPPDMTLRAGQATRSDPIRVSRGQSLLQELRAISRSPLLCTIAGLTVLLSLLINVGAYQFYLALQIAYAGHSQALTVFLGGFAFWTGLAALGMQLYVTGRVMTRFGIFTALLFFPVGMAISGVFGLLTRGALWTITLTRAADPVFRRTINDASLNALYLPVPADLRQRAKPLLEGAYALTFGVAGVLFLLMQRVPAWSYVYWSVPVLVVATCWVVLLIWGRRQYVDAVAESVSRRRLDFAGGTLDIADETTVGILVRALHSPDDLQVVHVLQLIASTGDPAWDRHVAPLFTHPSPQVRTVALRCLGRDGNPAHAEQVATLLHAPEADVRAAAIEAYCAMAVPDFAGPVARFLDDPGARIKGAAVTGLLAHGGREARLGAAGYLKMMLEDRDPDMRREAAHVLGALAGYAVDTTISTLVQDSSAALSSAVGAEGALPDDTLVAQLVRLLDDKATRAVAADGLVRHGADSLPALRDVLENGTRDREVRAQVARILRRIGGRSAAEILLGHLAESDEVIRSAVYRALGSLRVSGTDVPVEDATLHAQINAEIRGFYALCVLREDLNSGGEELLLTDTLTERMSHALDRVFSLLEVRYPGHTLERMRRALDTTEGSTRAMASELLDNLVERRLKDLLIPLIEAPVERVIEIAGTHLAISRRPAVERLRELAEGADPWLRACAIFRIGTVGIPQLASVVRTAVESDDPMVCEAALAACRRLLEPAELAQVLIDQADGARSPTVRRYAQSLLQNIRLV